MLNAEFVPSTDEEVRFDEPTLHLVGGDETLINRRTGNLRAVQQLFGQSKIESMVRYLGVEVDDALQIAEKTDV